MILQERQRAIQIRRNSELVGDVEEVNVEGRQRGSRPVDRPHIAQPHAQLHAAADDEPLVGQVRPRAGDTRPVRIRWLARASEPNTFVGIAWKSR